MNHASPMHSILSAAAVPLTAALALATPQHLVAAHEAKLLDPTPGTTDLFGYAFAKDGDRIVVGSYLDDNGNGGDAGSAQPFVFSGGDWIPEGGHLYATGGASGDNFGIAVGTSGETTAIGAWLDNTPAGADAGSVYVFTLCGGSWIQTAQVFHPAGAAGDRFGYRLALDGDTLVVGAYDDDTCQADSGSVHVYVRDSMGDNDPCNDQWPLQATLSPSVCQSSAFFGISLALQGDRLVVGASGEFVASGRTGAAYVFERTGSTWTETAHLLAGNGLAGDEFGHDVALDGDTIVVAARMDDTSSGVDAGSVHVFRLQSGFWFLEQNIDATTASDPIAAGDQFGMSVDVQGNALLVGCWGDDDAGSSTGSAHLYRRVGSSWTHDQKVTLTDAAGGDEFGLAVEIDGDRMLVGARHDDEVGTDTGSVGVYRLSLAAFDAFGFGDGSGTACPCGNNSYAHLEQGCKNSRGAGGKLSASGSSLATANDFVMRASNLIPNNPALLFSGPNKLNGGNGNPFGNGLRVVGGQLDRHGIRAPTSDGRATWGPGVPQVGGWIAGSTVHFQVWYRDPFHGSCVDVFNVTNGLSITFQ